MRMSALYLILIVYYFARGTTAYVTEYDGEEFCERSNFNAQCASRELLVMTSAIYGTLKIGKCIDQKFGTKCPSDVMKKVDSLCSGMRNCSFYVGSLNHLSTCTVQTFSRQLIASYQCVKVNTCKTDKCLQNPHIKITEPSGMLSNYLPREESCGHSPCTWSIQSKPGQKLNFTLYYFPGVTEDDDRRKSASPGCHTVALIKGASSSSSKEVKVCARQTRISTFQISGGGNVQVNFLTSVRTSNDNRYILKYQVVGCPNDIDIPIGTAVERDGPSMTVRCLNSARAWHIICDGTAWVGETGICDTVHNKQSSNGPSSIHNITSSPSGMLIVVGIGLAIGIVLGMCLLTLVMMYMKRRRRRPYEYPIVDSSVVLDQSTYCPYMEKPVLIHESEYQCTHARPAKCPHKRPDLNGFRPIPEGETVEDLFIEQSVDQGIIDHNTSSFPKPCLYERPILDVDSQIGRLKNTH